jgi:pimeloyl-ACP methyl ester carboxylesterase
MQTSPRSHQLSLSLGDPFGRINMHALDWGNENARRVAICVHGLTRNAHDFDWIAPALAAEGRRVFALDMPGRGNSPKLSDPMLYGYPLYVALCAALMDNFHVREVEWIGTSMGGLIGMMLAATQPRRISKLVMNDIGARITTEGITRIMRYASSLPSGFTSKEAAVAYMRPLLTPFGIREESILQAFIDSSIRADSSGNIQLKTDPAIAIPLLSGIGTDTPIAPVDLSGLWESVTCPTLILRGEHSDLLSPETVSAMLSSNLRATTTTIAGCGHAPSLTSDTEIAEILRFLNRDSLALPSIVGF